MLSEIFARCISSINHIIIACLSVAYYFNLTTKQSNDWHIHFYILFGCSHIYLYLRLFVIFPYFIHRFFPNGYLLQGHLNWKEKILIALPGYGRILVENIFLEYFCIFCQKKYESANPFIYILQIRTFYLTFSIRL